ncbi:MAG TPA: PspC domain-containing protein [Acidimicrobiales bacterium]|nr:PspC domain-containing protein [Acidimicrobiales bacterium]
MRRSTSDRMAGGVAGGLSARFGIDANLIRFAFVLVALGAGTGLAAYVVAWLVIPAEGTSTSIGRRALADRRTVGLALAFVTALGAVVLVLGAIGLSFAVNLVWPVSIAVAGLVLVWRGADAEERTHLSELMGRAPLIGSAESRTRRATVARVVVGVVLVAVGLGALVASAHPSVATVRAVLAVNVVIVGFLVAFGPWWLRLARDLAMERRERVRNEERANMAAAVHDSVLQTLALIQRAAGDQGEVTRLARAQERELRAWLFEGRAPGSFNEAEVTTVSQAVAVIVRDVEASHRVAVESVLVGDCELTGELRALLAAGREATVNAATWSGAPVVSIFVEVEPAQVSVFVRDRGQGFAPGAVARDRRGIAESIRARMTRHGGSAVIRSAPDQGTEIELIMPRTGAGRE